MLSWASDELNGATPESILLRRSDVRALRALLVWSPEFAEPAAPAGGGGRRAEASRRDRAGLPESKRCSLAIPRRVGSMRKAVLAVVVLALSPSAAMIPAAAYGGRPAESGLLTVCNASGERRSVTGMLCSLPPHLHPRADR
jgi:hypothetical protein